MNTRRKLLLAKPVVPSEKWHLLHEPYEPFFEPKWKDHVEEWYNICATGVQREHFRTMCLEMYKMKEKDKAIAEAKEALLSKYTAFVNETEIDLLLTTYGKVFTELGLSKARIWLRTVGATAHQRNLFRGVFGACQAIFKNNSTMYEDYAPIDSTVFKSVNRQHLHKSIDWFRVKGAAEGETQKRETINMNRYKMLPVATLHDKEQQQQQQKEKEHHHKVYPFTQQQEKPESQLTASTILAEESLSSSAAAANDKLNIEEKKSARFTKPKSQFDGVNYLSTVGYEHLPLEEAVSALQAKRLIEINNDRYYTVPDEEACLELNIQLNATRNNANHHNKKNRINNNNNNYIECKTNQNILKSNNQSYTVYKAGVVDKNVGITTRRQTCDLTKGVYTEPISEWTVKTLENNINNDKNV